MSLITLMNIVRVRFYVFYHAKLQFDAGGRSLESLLNTRRTKRCLRMCANWMEKFHPFPLQLGEGGNINVRSTPKTIASSRETINPVFSNPIFIELSRRFSFSTRRIVQKTEGQNPVTFSLLHEFEYENTCVLSLADSGEKGKMCFRGRTVSIALVNQPVFIVRQNRNRVIKLRRNIGAAMLNQR